MDDTKVINKKKFNKLVHDIYKFLSDVFLDVIIIILSLVAIGIVATFIDSTINAKKSISKPPLLGAYIIVTPSMVPTIKVEDAIVIKRIDSNKLKKDDIITFLSNDSRYSGLTITHRIVDIKNENGELHFYTKGDNNNSNDDGYITSDKIKGKVILKIPKIGYIQYFLTQTYGWILLIILPCLCILIVDIVKLSKSIRKSSSKKSNEKKDEEEEEEIEVI